MANPVADPNLSRRPGQGSGRAASLYLGEVMHARLKPVGHRFTYRVLSLLIDLDRLIEADGLSFLFGVNRGALFSFHERDHGPRDGSSLRAHAARLLAPHGIDLAQGRVLLLCYPRVFGYVFNPLSVYYCYTRDGALTGLIYEVRNMFGEMHSYVRPVIPTDLSAAGIRQSELKAFYVSPFIAMGTRYNFRLTPPGEEVRLRILETDAEGPLLAATFVGRRRLLTSRELLADLLRLPFVTAKVMVGIHYEAMRLWLKGAPLYARPRQAHGRAGNGL
jgi:DUF1365 family protein